MINLQKLLRKYKVTQRALADALNLSPATVSAVVTKGRWPKTGDRKTMKQTIKDVLDQAGASKVEVAGAFKRIPKKSKAQKAKTITKETAMLLRRQGLFPKTKRHFGLGKDPFDEIHGHDDVFLSKDIRYVRESLFTIAKHGGFMAVIGESGSGKSTLRRDLADRINRDSLPVHIIEPYVLAMEDNDKSGRTLKAMHIAEAIMGTVAPGERVNGSPEARFRQIHRILRDSGRSGNTHCLIIEEAHGLPLKTLKHLKRFLELEDGFRKLLSVILLGQPELKFKLSEGNHEVREVVQRCEVVELLPMNGSLSEYIKFKFDRAGVDAGKVISDDGIEALRTKLTGPTPKGSPRDSVSLVYPLAVGNMVTASMNLAAELGAPLIDAGIIKQV